eukprot:PhF_6_TR11359/c0_g1_i1/m.18326
MKKIYQMWNDAVLYDILKSKLVDQILYGVQNGKHWEGNAIAISPTTLITPRHVVSGQSKKTIWRNHVCIGTVQSIVRPPNSRLDYVLLHIDTFLPFVIPLAENVKIREEDIIVLAYISPADQETIVFTSGLARGYDAPAQTFCVEGSKTVPGASGGVAMLLRNNPLELLYAGMHIGRNDDALGRGLNVAEFVSFDHALKDMP